MADKAYYAVRSSPFLWYMRFIQLLFTLIVLGLVGEAASIWHGLYCNTPSNVALDIAVVVFTAAPGHLPF